MRLLTATLFTALLSAPAFAADLGTYRPGTSYSSVVAPGADVCDSQCAGDAQCRAWNYVKPNPKATGVCEFLSSASTPVSSQISISGENVSAAPFSSRITSGSTNTVRVGTTVIPRSTNTVKVGQTTPSRRIVREAPNQRVTPQQTSIRPIQDMSLTAQQNRYRQDQNGQNRIGQTQIQRPVQRQAQPTSQSTRPMFRPLLDAPSPRQGYAPRQPQQLNRSAPEQVNQRRATGPRRAPAQIQHRGQTGPVPHTQQQPYPFQNPNQNFGQNPRQGASRPPVGQPIAPPQNTQRRRPSTPSQRLAQLTAQTAAQRPAVGQPTPPIGPVALNPEQARQSLFGRLNDDVRTPRVAPEATPQDMPIVTAVPTRPIAQESLGAPYGEQLAGGR